MHLKVNVTTVSSHVDELQFFSRGRAAMCTLWLHIKTVTHSTELMSVLMRLISACAYVFCSHEMDRVLSVLRLRVSVGLWITCKWWMLKCLQGESWPSGFDPAPCRSSSPSARSRRTLNWASLPVTWCHPTWLASPSCPTTAASKETCPPVLIPRYCHLWTLPAWVHHGNNAKGNSEYFVKLKVHF